MSDIKSFLKVMSKLESSEGKNLNHKPMEHGMHEGQAAIGQYGLMPNTIKEIAGRVDSTELDNIINNADPSAVKEIVEKNPHKYDKYANYLAERLMDKTDNNIPEAAAGWLYGHNQSPEQIKEKLKNDPEYSKRIESAMAGMQSKNPTLIEQLLKDQNQDVLMSQKPAPRLPAANPEGPQLRQGTGKEQPIAETLGTFFNGINPSFKERDEMQQMFDNAAGMANVGGVVKAVPKAMSAAEQLVAAAANPSRFGKIIQVVKGEQPGIGKVIKKGMEEAPQLVDEAKALEQNAVEQAKLNYEQLRKNALSAAKKRSE